MTSQLNLVQVCMSVQSTEETGLDTMPLYVLDQRSTASFSEGGQLSTSSIHWIEEVLMTVLPSPPAGSHAG